MALQQGNISIHAQNIMPIIKRWLYSDKDIFIRELVSNGCDAITKQKMLAPGNEAEYKVTVTVDEPAEDGSVVYHLHVSEGDMGRVIGKQGRIAKAIRTVMRAAATRQNARVVVEID